MGRGEGGRENMGENMGTDGTFTSFSHTGGDENMGDENRKHGDRRDVPQFFHTATQPR